MSFSFSFERSDKLMTNYNENYKYNFRFLHLLLCVITKDKMLFMTSKFHFQTELYYNYNTSMS